MSTERVIVDAKVADDFAARLTKRVAALPVGNPLEGEFVIGSVVGKPTIERLQRLVGDAVKQGAKVLAGADMAPWPARAPS
jgi:benzaldehyde dehydrogenase (NAD)